jgi:hypothetical protein
MSTDTTDERGHAMSDQRGHVYYKPGSDGLLEPHIIPSPWRCPVCSSDQLRVYYTERRTCYVTTGPARDEDPQPWPSYQADDFVSLDEDSFAFHCDACLAEEITPVFTKASPPS